MNSSSDESSSRGRAQAPQPDDDHLSKLGNDRLSPQQGRRRQRIDPARERRVHVRLSDDEWHVAATGARDCGLAVAAFAARATLAAAAHRTEPRPPSLLQVELRTQLHEINVTRVQLVRIGVLLNQAVAKLNATGEAPLGLPYLAGRVATLVSELDRLTAAVMDKEWTHG